ncbi:MAG: universal stress protein [Halobacteriota archaeon]
MYENILLPVDESAGTDEAITHASEIAQVTGATVRVLFVADSTRDSVTVVGTDVVDALVEEGEAVVEKVGATLETLGADFGTDVVQGAPAPTIVEYAERYEYDLIVMSTHGRRGLSRQLLGSVTEKVVRLSTVPVCTLRMQTDVQATFPYETILVPTDGSTAATRAAQHGLALADALDATVHVLSVVDDTRLGIDVRSTQPGHRDERAAKDAVDDIVSEADARGIPVVEHVEHGTPHDEILASVDANDVDAIVMGTTGRSGVDRILLGSVAERTVRTAPVPVITVATE